jgi:hypothetical protein
VRFTRRFVIASSVSLRMVMGTECSVQLFGVPCPLRETSVFSFVIS